VCSVPYFHRIKMFTNDHLQYHARSESSHHDCMVRR
jgi:hypothetical protein